MRGEDALRLWADRPKFQTTLLGSFFVLGVIGSVITKDVGLLAVFLAGAVLMLGLSSMNYVSLGSTELRERRWANGRRSARYERSDISGAVVSQFPDIFRFGVDVQFTSGRDVELLSQRYFRRGRAQRAAEAIESWCS
jgi:hypothetical protein